ncbi:DNA topoisomerase [Blastocladiella britannica]|nr:DNA topoisomerase [Blastocladiella britannica]
MSDSGSDFLASDTEFEQPAPAPTSRAKKQPAATTTAAKKPRGRATAAAATKKTVTDSASSENTPPTNGRAAAGAIAGGTKTVEEMYQKKSQLEHILLRPDTYIGSVEALTAPMWVLNESDVLENRSITYVPGLYKIFDEILVNAADNKIRDGNMNALKVNIDPSANQISVYNNGKGIPISIHREEGVYVPELIFGHLLTSSNYDDDERKVTGGRNGFGAKLCNIFSTEFIVETADGEKCYKQTFSQNMSQKSAPVITANKRGEQYTRITFRPDLAKFKMPALDADIVALLKKRVYDMAGCCRGVKVSLNNKPVKIKDFKSYVAMYMQSQAGGASQDGSNNNKASDDDDEDNYDEGDKDQQAALPIPTKPLPVVVYEQQGTRWEVAIAASDDDHHQMSFVNSICTSKGGTHVDHITTQVVAKLMEVIKKKHKNTTLRPSQVKAQMWVFVNCLIENPTFDSQTKENMTLRASAFGSKCVLSDDFHKKVLKSGILERLLSAVEAKQDQLLKKTDGKKKSRISGIPKLDDATKAGTRDGSRCTLILTEGDSAKALAMSGLSEVGRELFGVFPLRGKLLNVRDAPLTTVSNNAEISALKQILGLQQGKVYSDTASLRYGHLMIMTDQDHDGSHIKGLIINFLDHYWPSLLTIPGFLCEFITPIVKCTTKRGAGGAGGGGGKSVLSFYTIPEYEQWREAHNAARYTIKYYKGLGTSTREEAKTYFRAIRDHRKPFDACSPRERVLIDMAFNKKKADERKQWLAQFEPGTFMDHSQASIPMDEFINRELILFSIADNHRSIPSMVDGLKPGQRKIMFACFKRKLTQEIKVAQLAGYVSEHSAYHHGEQSLCTTIVNLAQDYVGSNNITLLSPRGQFGTRMQGGADAASARYIFTTLTPLAQRIYHPKDKALLRHLDDDGKLVEPEWYMPVVPMVLINGTTGIGTGWSTAIPNYNPRDVVANVRRMLRGEQPEPMHPWYQGFRGTIEPFGAAGNRYNVAGRYELTGQSLRVTELPIGLWTQTFKQMVEEFTRGDDPCVLEFIDESDDALIDFQITLTPQAAALGREAIEKKFKLTTTLATSNMVCFDQRGCIKKYGSAHEILVDYFALRMDFYVRRKAALTKEHQRQYDVLENKMRFVREVIDRSLVIERKRKADLVAELRRRGYMVYRESGKDGESNEEAGAGAAEESAAGGGGGDEATTTLSITDYDYLLRLPLYSLTEERIAELAAQLANERSMLDRVLSQTPADMWDEDLDEFEAEYDALLEQHERDGKKSKGRAAGTTTKSRAPAKGRKRAAAAALSDEDDDGDEAEYTVPKRARKIAAPIAAPIIAATAAVPSAVPAAAAAAPKRVRAPKAAAAAATTSAPATKRTVAPKAKVVDLTDDEDDINDKADSVKQPRAVAPKPPTAPAATKAPPPPPAMDDELDKDEDEDDSLAARLARIRARVHGNANVALSSVSTSARLSPARLTAAKQAARPAAVEQAFDESDDAMDVAESPVVSRRKAPARTSAGRRTAKTPVVIFDSGSDSDYQG